MASSTRRNMSHQGHCWWFMCCFRCFAILLQLPVQPLLLVSLHRRSCTWHPSIGCHTSQLKVHRPAWLLLVLLLLLLVLLLLPHLSDDAQVKS
jgi:hypothetical protein